MSVHATHETVPERVGRYDVLFPLETGTVTSILVGRVAEPGSSPVTIRRIAPAVTHGKDLAGFLARTSEAPKVKHANVVGIREVFEDGTAICVVMDYLEGETAAAVVRRLSVENKPLGAELAAWIVAEAAAGIDAGHALGILHEHLTPHEVFVGHDGTAKIFDGGIARALAELTGASTIATTELPYAPPERCKGERLDRKSDVYSLGTVLWELMTGVSPYERESDADTLRAILGGDPRLPPTSVLRSLPTELSEIALRALDRDPAKRYPTALALREALLGFVGATEASASLAILMQNVFAKRIRNNARLLRRADSNRSVAVRSPLAIETPPDPIEPAALDLPTVQAFQPVPLAARGSVPDVEPPSSEPAPMVPQPDSQPSVEERARVEKGPAPVEAPGVEAERIEVDARAIELARAEADAVEPIAVMQTPAERPMEDAAVDEPSPRRTPRTLLVGVVVAIAVAVIVLAWFETRREDAKGAPIASASTAPPRALPSSSIAAPTPPPASSAVETTLRVETVPTKAAIILDGASIGISPMDVKVPRGDKAVILELRRAGYQPLRESIVPDMDQKLRLVLVPSTRAAAPPPPAPTPSAAPSAGPYHRFD